MGMIQHDELKALAYGLARRVHEFKKIVHSPPIRILELVNATTLIRFGRIMCLRRLIEHENSRDWSALLPEPTMQSQESYYMIPDPILSTTDPVEGDRSCNRFSHHGELLEIEPYAPFGVFQGKAGRIARHMIRDQVEKGIDSFFNIVGTHAFSKDVNPSPGFLDERVDIFPFVRQVGLIQKCADSSDNACPFDDLITLDACFFVIHVSAFQITLNRNNSILDVAAFLTERIQAFL